VLRIHFTATDLARTRVAPTLGPLAETLLATRLLQYDDSDPFHGWRQQARRHTPLHTSLLGWLYGGNGYLPDLFTIVGRVDGLDKGLDALLAAPASLLRGELDILADQRPLPSAAQALAAGDRAARIELIAAIRQVHGVWGTSGTDPPLTRPTHDARPVCGRRISNAADPSITPAVRRVTPRQRCGLPARAAPSGCACRCPVGRRRS
jgi:hypothetical protein